MRLSVSPRGRLVVNVVYAAVFTVAGMSPEVPGLGTVLPDAAAHAVGVGFQVLMLFWLARELLPSPMALAVSSAGAFLFGAMIELLQLFQPARQTQLSDIAANGVGALAAVFVIAVLLTFARLRAVHNGAC
jgi:VanZ family protein